MKKLFLIIPLIAMFLLVIEGCKREAENPASSTVTQEDDPNSQVINLPKPTSYNGMNPSNILAVIRASAATGTKVYDAGMAFGAFGFPSKDQGNIYLTYNNNVYPFTKAFVNNNTFYAIVPHSGNPTGIPLESGSGTVTFSSTGFPLSDSSVTVPGQILISAPEANSEVSRDRSLVVSWKVSGEGTNKAIFINDHRGKFYFKEVTGTQDNAEFTSQEMASLAAGKALVYVLTYSFKLVNNNQAVLLGESLSTNVVNLQK